MTATTNGGGTAIQPQQQRGPSRLDTVRDLLEKAKPRLAEVTPKHLTADRLTRVAIAAMGRTPNLLKCTPASLLNSIMQAAQLGLEPGSALGEAYLVPYKETCQLIVGYRGLISLARRSGQIASIEAHVVHEKDRFVCKYGLASQLEHEPDWSDDPGPVVAVYAVARLKDGATQVEVMTKAQVDAIRKRSRASGDGPWTTDYEEMARKTVVRRICKYLPLSIELAEALAIEDAVDVLDVPREEPVGAGSTRTEGVKARLRGKSEKAAAATPAEEPQPVDAAGGGEPAPEQLDDVPGWGGGEGAAEPGSEG